MRTTQEKLQTEANEWIENQWLGKSVKQARGIPSLIGRVGKVAETLWDENGALHCKMAPEGWWCPASMLEML